MNNNRKIAQKVLEQRQEKQEKKKQEQQEQQQKIALANAQALEIQKKQYLFEASKQYRRFFRPLLNQMPCFNTVGMRCDAINTNGSMDSIRLQIPLSAQSTVPSNVALAQMIENLLIAECDQCLHNLADKAYQLQMFCSSPEKTYQYNKLVDDCICYFMYYHVQVVKTNGFKADIIIEAVLNNALMQSYYLYF